ncbi:MAG: hypothetical protein KJ630_21425 [Proteobacteria bacterium]|nr:hypothetical protein [Pseudomonadota bacterium]
MKKQNSLFSLAHSHLHPSHFFSSIIPRLLKPQLSCILILLLFPCSGYSFSFNNLVDDVGNAVKKNVNSIDTSVKQVLPGDGKTEENASANSAPKKVAAANAQGDSSGQKEKMPAAKMTNISLQNEMIAELKNRGWSNVRRLVIVDKDWWNDLVSGGNSPVKSRHIAAAAAAKAADGSYYYCRVTFHQQKLASGGFGKLALTRTGEKKTILEVNIDK